MEIRNVNNEVKKEYPKIEQISKKYLENNIPNKWLKIGLISIGMTLAMKTKVLGVELAGDVDIAGDLTEVVPTNGIQVYSLIGIIASIISIVSIATFIITGFSIIRTKSKLKKQNEPVKIKKWIKVMFIISIILFILGIITIYKVYY